MKVLMRLEILAMITSLLLASSRRRFVSSAHNNGPFPTGRFVVAAFSSPKTVSTSCREEGSANNNDDDDEDTIISPWNNPDLTLRAEGKHAFRSRQHVNPLAAKFQQPTVLTHNWPQDTFDDLSRPLFLDIGCARGGFLVDISKQRPNDYNYLGLEIRPIVAHHAQQRVEKHGLRGHLGFVGCNANVDLDRLLTVYGAIDKLDMVTIQFPDPHFKARHAKRRVVTEELVITLAKFMPAGSTVFLQSDVQSVLDDMREQFRLQCNYFEDSLESATDYLQENILGIPTEREISVLDKGLPVFRSTFVRTDRAISTATP